MPNWVRFVQVMESNTDVMGKQRYWMCGGAESLTFKAPGGKVIYVGDVRYSQVGTSLGAKYKQDFEAAKKFIDSNFPGLRNRLEPWTYKVMPSSDSCTQTIYVPATR